MKRPAAITARRGVSGPSQITASVAATIAHDRNASSGRDGTARPASEPQKMRPAMAMALAQASISPASA